VHRTQQNRTLFITDTIHHDNIHRTGKAPNLRRSTSDGIVQQMRHTGQHSSTTAKRRTLNDQPATSSIIERGRPDNIHRAGGKDDTDERRHDSSNDVLRSALIGKRTSQ
jgi:hypothetical protein